MKCGIIGLFLYKGMQFAFAMISRFYQNGYVATDDHQLLFNLYGAWKPNLFKQVK